MFFYDLMKGTLGYGRLKRSDTWGSVSLAQWGVGRALIILLGTDIGFSIAAITNTGWLYLGSVLTLVAAGWQVSRVGAYLRQAQREEQWRLRLKPLDEYQHVSRETED